MFGWRSEGTGRGLRQSAYRLMVATRPECLCREEPDIWDSGEVSSEASIGIPYGGKPLDSARTYYWTVRVRDGEGSLSGWSEMQRWATGLLNEDDWHAKWIGPSIESVSPSSPLLRKSFEVDDLSQVESAYMYATALGLYYLRCNGEEVSDRKFAPGWSDYRSHVRYQTYDVKSLLRTGENAVGAVLGPGWYAGHIASFGDRKYGTHPAFLAQLVIRYTDGRRTTVVTDESWRIAEGPIREADLIQGETYDARLERDGWDRPGFRDADWLPAT
ncbi:MAG TPA: alpha-L-rhamnosidase N-terminal domain-containing protein, partial [Paenibacillus sp.]|nr:alpha-L-rhamnosidase N-terminal domain-containing protein [Paenibacillus sp.]